MMFSLFLAPGETKSNADIAKGKCCHDFFYERSCWTYFYNLITETKESVKEDITGIKDAAMGKGHGNYLTHTVLNFEIGLICFILFEI